VEFAPAKDGKVVSAVDYCKITLGCIADSVCSFNTGKVRDLYV